MPEITEDWFLSFYNVVELYGILPLVNKKSCVDISKYVLSDIYCNMLLDKLGARDAYSKLISSTLIYSVRSLPAGIDENSLVLFNKLFNETENAMLISAVDGKVDEYKCMVMTIYRESFKSFKCKKYDQSINDILYWCASYANHVFPELEKHELFKMSFMPNSYEDIKNRAKKISPNVYNLMCDISEEITKESILLSSDDLKVELLNDESDNDEFIINTKISCIHLKCIDYIFQYIRNAVLTKSIHFSEIVAVLNTIKTNSNYNFNKINVYMLCYGKITNGYCSKLLVYASMYNERRISEGLGALKYST